MPIKNTPHLATPISSILGNNTALLTALFIFTRAPSPVTLLQLLRSGALSNNGVSSNPLGTLAVFPSKRGCTIHPTRPRSIESDNKDFELIVNRVNDACESKSSRICCPSDFEILTMTSPDIGGAYHANLAGSTGIPNSLRIYPIPLSPHDTYDFVIRDDRYGDVDGGDK